MITQRLGPITLKSFISAINIIKLTIAITAPIGITVLDSNIKTDSLSLAPDSSTTPTEIINKNTTITEFCEKYQVTLSTTYVETSEYKPGTIYDQSQAPDSTVISGQSLKIYIEENP